MADSSFDIVSKVDRQELHNAVDQTAREIATRFDFKNVGASIALAGGDRVDMAANSEARVLAVLDVFKDKLVKRGISLKALDAGEPKLSGKEYRIAASLAQGISQEQAKKIGALIRERGPKGVRALVQGDELRVTGKKKDDLQAVQALLREQDLDLALQFTNYR